MNIIDTGLKFAGALTRRSSTTEIILHHAAGDGDVESIHNWHIYGNGWLGIGYHFYIRKDGTIYRGRPEEMVGGHTYGSNSTSIGICCEGNFENEKMSPAQKNSCGELVGYLLEKWPTVYKVSKHKDYNATACPGKNFPFEDIIAIASSYGAEVEPPYEVPEAEHTGKAGGKLELTKEPLYVSAYDTKPVNHVNGTYYLWDDVVIKGKVKITNSVENVGKYGQVTGWIDQPTAKTPEKEPEKKRVHKVVSGDTLSEIARDYGSTVDKIFNANKAKYPTMTRNYILIGWELEIP